jgi:hypothetical protein
MLSNSSVMTVSHHLGREGRGIDDLCVKRVDHMVTLQPFEGATNRTATLILEKGRATSYPLPYIVWTLRKGMRADLHAAGDLAAALAATEQTDLIAAPVQPLDKTSSWLTAPASCYSSFTAAVGQSPYPAHVGLHTMGANAVYWVEILRDMPKGQLLIRNYAKGAKKQVDETTVTLERDYVYPLLRGADLSRWLAEPSLYMISAQREDRPDLPVHEGALKRESPKTFACLHQFKDFLSSRVGYKKYLEPSKAPFYGLYGIKRYTMGDYKVGWNEIASRFSAAVIGPRADPLLGLKTVLPDHKITFAPCGSEDEAHYLCAVLNSTIVRALMWALAVETQMSPKLLESVAVPKFDPANLTAVKLAGLSKACHAERSAKRDGGLPRLESELDALVAEMWGISPSEVGTLQRILEAG